MALEVLMDRTFVFDSIPTAEQIFEKLNLSLPLDLAFPVDYLWILPQLFFWFDLTFQVLTVLTIDSSEGEHFASMILYDPSLSIEENLKFLHVLTVKYSD